MADLIIVFTTVCACVCVCVAVDVSIARNPCCSLSASIGICSVEKWFQADKSQLRAGHKRPARSQRLERAPSGGGARSSVLHGRAGLGRGRRHGRRVDRRRADAVVLERRVATRRDGHERRRRRRGVQTRMVAGLERRRRRQGHAAGHGAHVHRRVPPRQGDGRRAGAALRREAERALVRRRRLGALRLVRHRRRRQRRRVVARVVRQVVRPRRNVGRRRVRPAGRRVGQGGHRVRPRQRHRPRARVPAGHVASGRQRWRRRRVPRWKH